MIKSAEGPSPLEENLQKLADSSQASVSKPDSASGRGMVVWAASALHLARVDKVQTEKLASLGSASPENVVGEIRGRDKPEEFVVLGAPLEIGDPPAGSSVNKWDAALVIDAARVIHASGNIPRRSIRFVLFDDHAIGERGSREYVQEHRLELDQMVAAIIFGYGTGRTTGYSLGGRKDDLAPVREALDPLKSFAPLELKSDARADADDLDFMLEGVPTLLATRGTAIATQSSSAAAKAAGKIDISEMKRSVAIAAVTAYALADAPARIGERQTRAEIEQRLRDTGLEESMKTDGTWAAWEKGKLGRQP